MTKEEKIHLLKTDVEKWNKYHHEIVSNDTRMYHLTDLSGADFSNLDLSNAYLGLTDLSNCNFSLSNLSNAYLWRAVAKNAIFFKTKFFHASCRFTDFTESRFYESDFRNSVLTKTSFKKSLLEKTDFYGSLIEGTSFDMASFNESKNIFQFGPMPKFGKMIEFVRTEEGFTCNDNSTFQESLSGLEQFVKGSLDNCPVYMSLIEMIRQIEKLPPQK